MAQIHPTAVVDRGAQVADDAIVGPFCYVGPKATIGPGCRLVSHVTVIGKTTLGRGNTLWPQVVLGADPQDLKFQGEETQLVVGDNNDIREMVTAHTGTANGGGFTRIGSDNLLMGGVHIAHDCEIGSHVIIANGVGLAGHVKIEDHVNIGGAVGVHHFVTFGQYCFVGGMSRVIHDVPPFMTIEGNPSAVRGINEIGLKRHRFPPETIKTLWDCFRRLYREKGQADGGSLLTRLDEVEREHGGDDCVRLLAQSLRNASSGMYGRHREGQRTDSRRRTAVNT
ncbi:MAG: acyl-ACP--UDP-N-acetylglucosamine O-acyltransferase [Planctomycetota bacterium]|nr:acyl-ACP--UDP-N-acetylglucosamine O-acyltransferase [Planctomycetota bacterium]